MKTMYTWFDVREKCPICISDSFKVIYQKNYDQPPIKDYLINFYSSKGMVEFEYLSGVPYVLCQCYVCRGIFQKYIPNAHLTKRLYGVWLDPKKLFIFHQKNDGLGYYSYYAQEVMQIVSFFKKKPSSLLFLDFGTGWGKWALIAKAFGCNVYGLEISQGCVEYVKSNKIKMIKFSEIHQYRFDFINIEQVFEHIAKPLQVLSYLKEALKTDGFLKISVPTANDINRRLKIMDWNAAKGTRNSINAIAPLEHINFFRRFSLQKMAGKANMEEIFVPLKLQYRYMCDWGGIKRIAKNILLPLYRNVLKRQNYVFFRNKR